ncbi:MAG: integrase core domain-containing protein [Planctomycetota bacterium]|jgi:putative transposase
MKAAFQAALAFVYAYFMPRYQLRDRFYAAQIKILLRILHEHGVQRVISTPSEKEELLRIGKGMDHLIEGMFLINDSQTYRRWRRMKGLGKELGYPGRKKKFGASVRALVVRLVLDNPLWGYLRVCGEMKKLGHSISGNTVKYILKQEGITPPPAWRGRKREGTLPWDTFISANIHSLVACDFFLKKIHTIRGTFEAHCLLFIHLGTRRVFVTPSTLHPHEAYLKQQARNVAMWLDEQGLKITHLIRDGDKKYPQSFDSFFQDLTGKKNAIVQTSFRAPNMNAYSESWIGRFKAECLNHIFCFSLNQLDHVVSQYQDYHNQYRPHQGKDIGNRVLDPDFVPPEHPSAQSVQRKKILGGLLNHYFNDDLPPGKAAQDTGASNAA